MSFLPNLACIISHPRRYFSEKSLVLLSKFKVEQGNQVKTSRVVIKKSRFTLLGNDNQVQLNNELVHNSSIFVRGTGNQIVIDENARVSNMQITIKGDYSYIYIGQGTHLGGGTIVCGGKGTHLHIGRDCMIAEDTDIWNSDSHTLLQNGEMINFPLSIEIGDHVWLGKGVTILKGVHIGDNAIIGMKSLVTKDIRPGTLNVGVPAHEIRDNVSWQR